MLPMRGQRLILIVAGLALGEPRLPATEVSGPVSEPTVELPTYTVEGTFPAEGWFYARVGRTEILSKLSIETTRTHLDDFLIFQDFVRAKFPEFAPPLDQPVTIVLCDRNNTFQDFVGQTGTGSTKPSAWDRFIIVNTSAAYQVDKLIRRRWMKLGIRRQSGSQHPLWRQEATSQILSDILIRDGRLELGLPPFVPAGTSTPGFNQFNVQHTMAMSQVFGMTADGLKGDEELAWNFHATSTAFVHLCLFSVRYKKFRGPYQQLLRRLEHEPMTEQLFRDCFGVDYAEMGRWVNDYAVRDSHMKYETQFYRISSTPPFEVRAAKPAEVLRMLGEARRIRDQGDQKTR